MLAGAEDLAHDAAVLGVGGDDLPLGKVLSELAHEDAEFAGGHVDGAHDGPVPGVGVAEVAALGEDVELDALVFGTGGNDLALREVLAGLAHEDGDGAVLGLDAPAIPHPRSENEDAEKDKRGPRGAGERARRRAARATARNGRRQRGRRGGGNGHWEKHSP